MRNLLLALALLPLSVHAQDSAPVWLTYGPDGPVARTYVAAGSECPHITIDGRQERMRIRALAGPNYKMTSCEAHVPVIAKSASIGERPLPVHKLHKTAKVAILGDTGCRRALGYGGKPPNIQDCNDIKKWPFETVANSIADWDPDLILNVGDYYYREAIKTKSGTWVKSTYDWSRWNADFFTPAARLLPNAPWVMSRGNHESCDRAAEGWFRYLDTRRYSYESQKMCKSNLDWTPPYDLRIGDMRVIVYDSSAIVDYEVESNQVDIVKNQLGLYAGKAAGAWMMLHHPFWGWAKGGQETETMSNAWAAAKADVPNPALMLSGHMHLLELSSFSDNVLPQLVVGNGGTDLDHPEPEAPTEPVAGRTVTDFFAHDDFGWIAATHDGGKWTFDIRDQYGKSIAVCGWAEGSAVTCSKP
jgi:Calcineurin-like phosphoesterase